MTRTTLGPPSAAQVRRAVLAMSRAERRVYLRERGWWRISGGGAEMWRAQVPEDRALYTLAAATYLVLARAWRGGAG